MAQKEEFQIIYDGEALKTHEMDVRELAPALLAVGDLLEETNNILYGETAKVNVNVKGSFKTGCFQVDFTLVQSLASQVSAFLNTKEGISTVAILGVLGLNALNGFGLLPFIKWVKNRNIKKITKIGNGKSSVEIDDDRKEVEDIVLDLYRSIRIRNSLESIIYKPLQKEGYDSFAVKHKEHIIYVKDGEKEYFKSPDIPDSLVDDKTYDTVLQAVVITFTEGNKWRFTDGGNEFYATILDENFVNQVQSNKIAFAKDDILKVSMHKVTHVSNGILKSEYEIVKVISHESVGKQIPLPFVKNEKEKT